MGLPLGQVFPNPKRERGERNPWLTLLRFGLGLNQQAAEQIRNRLVKIHLDWTGDEQVITWNCGGLRRQKTWWRLLFDDFDLHRIVVVVR